MILDQQQITSIIIDNPNRALIHAGCQYTKRLRLHLYGDGLDQHINMIEGFEQKWLRDLRVKYTKSNKDLFSRLGRPIDKVFSARGGSVYYNLTDAQDRQARILTSDVRDGYSVRKWIEAFWKPHMLDDPFGMIFLEMLPTQQAMQAKQQGKSFVYPTYKAISSVYDYQPKGSSLEYVVFNVSKEEKRNAGLKEDDQVYRVVDDAFDYFVKRDGDTVSILQSLTFPNFFSSVPAMLNSDIIDPCHDLGVLSFYDDAIELAAHFLLKGSIKVTHDFRHGFPKYSEFADDCGKCNGTGWSGAAKCDECKGTGKRPMTKVSDLKLLTWPNDKDAPIILPKDVGGYISPDKTYYEISTSDLQMLEDQMNVTLWGMQSRVKAQGPTITPGGDAKTATEIKDEVKPQTDRLHPISEMAEKRDKFIRDHVIRLNMKLFSYGGSSVNYGRRYMMEGPDAVWDKYSKARANGAAISALDDLLVEYYEARYSSDPVKLAIQLKLMRVEPFVHYKVGEVMGFNPGEEDYKAKLYFGEWLSEQNDGILLSSDVKMLRESLYQYAATKQLKPEPQPIAA